MNRKKNAQGGWTPGVKAGQSEMAAHAKTLAGLFARTVPDIVRRLPPARLFFDKTRRARRLKKFPEQWSQPPKGFPPAHRHPVFELCIVLAGRLPFLFGPERIELKSGDVVVVSPEVYHRELAADCGGKYRLMWIACRRNDVFVHIMNHAGNGRYAKPCVQAAAAPAPEALALATAVDVELWEDRPGSFTRAQGLFLQLCGLLERAFSDASSHGPPPGNSDPAAMLKWRVSSAMEYVRDHCSHPLDLAEVAAHVGVSSNYLSALFTRALGRTFTDFLTGCRLDDAERLLRDPSLSIKQVAQRVGFDNAFYFSRLFRKHTGLSPKLRRQRLAASK
jgi:AraC-like DNA-binding protein